MIVKTYKQKDGSKEFEGILTAYDKDSITIQIEETDIVFMKSEVALVKLAFDF